MEIANQYLLLLDLDGVVVFEGGPPLCDVVEILALHELLADNLTRIGMPVVVLTHRSRPEARRILSAAEVPPESLAGVMSAEDLLWSGLRHAQFRRLIFGGLRKSLILPEIERRFQIPRSRLIMIDDRDDNVEDLIKEGLGLVIQAPSSVDADRRSLITFDFAEAVRAIGDWLGTNDVGRVIRLPPVEIRADDLSRTGYSTNTESRHAFNATRSFVRQSRQYLARRFVKARS